MRVCILLLTEEKTGHCLQVEERRVEQSRVEERQRRVEKSRGRVGV